METGDAVRGRRRCSARTSNQKGTAMKRSFAMCFALVAGRRRHFFACAGGTPARRPNVLFIAVDDLNCRIHCYGDPLVKTPNLDRLARSGVRFERADRQFPLCNPSRISLFLGRYPTTTETIDFAEPALLGPDWVTLPEHFRRSGYEVSLLGKIFHYPEPKPWSAGQEAVWKQQRRHREMLADLTRWEPYRTLAPPPPGWTTWLRDYANHVRPGSQHRGTRRRGPRQGV